MFLFGKVSPLVVVKSAVVCAALALAEYLLIRPGITMAEKASAVKVSVASDFFMVAILY
jgi:hypothetical protein